MTAPHTPPRRARLLIGSLLVATTASFLYATRIGAVRQGWAYYDTAARFWELGVGALAGLLIGRIVMADRVRAVLGVAGFLVVINTAATAMRTAVLAPVATAMALVRCAATRRP